MRKRPVQKRSQQMVEALLDAAAQVVVEQGLEHFTTIEVAARAGVSVGSLYQYFSNKEALLAALLDRMTQRLGVVVNRTAPLLLQADLRTITRGLLLAALDFFDRDAGLSLELLRNWHRLDIAHGLHLFEQNMMEVMRAYLLAHTTELRIENIIAKQFVVTNSVVFSLMRYLSLPERPPFAREQLVEELTALIGGYLEPRGEPRAKPKGVPARRRAPRRVSGGSRSR